MPDREAVRGDGVVCGGALNVADLNLCPRDVGGVIASTGDSEFVFGERAVELVGWCCGGVLEVVYVGGAEVGVGIWIGLFGHCLRSSL